MFLSHITLVVAVVDLQFATSDQNYSSMFWDRGRENGIVFRICYGILNRVWYGGVAKDSSFVLILLLFIQLGSHAIFLLTAVVRYLELEDTVCEVFLDLLDYDFCGMLEPILKTLLVPASITKRNSDDSTTTKVETTLWNRYEMDTLWLNGLGLHEYVLIFCLWSSTMCLVHCTSNNKPTVDSDSDNTSIRTGSRVFGYCYCKLLLFAAAFFGLGSSILLWPCVVFDYVITTSPF